MGCNFAEDLVDIPAHLSSLPILSSVATVWPKSVRATFLRQNQVTQASITQTTHPQTPQGVVGTWEVVTALRSAGSSHFTCKSYTHQSQPSFLSPVALVRAGCSDTHPSHPRQHHTPHQGVSKTQEAGASSPYTMASQVASIMAFSPSDNNHTAAIVCGGKQPVVTVFVGYTPLVSTSEAPLSPSLSHNR